MSDATSHGRTFLTGGGATGAEIRAFDWSTSSLGDAETWPEMLRATLATMLSSPQPMFMAWGDDLITFFNDGYRPILGQKITGAIGLPFADLWADVWQDIAPIVQRTLTGEGASFTNMPLTIRRNGYPEATWWSFTYMPLRDASGTVRGMLCATNETTAEVQAVTGLRQSERRQRHLLQQMPGFVGVLSGPDHVFEYVNDAYVAISGPRDFLGRSVRDVFPELAGQGHFERLDQVYATGEPFAAKGARVRLDGEDADRFIDHMYQPIQADDGRVTGVFVGGYEVSDRARSENRRETLLALDRRLGDLKDTGDLSFAASQMLGEALGVARVGYGTIDADAGTITVVRNWSAPGFRSVAGVHDFTDYGDYIADLLHGVVVANADVRADRRTARNADAFRKIGVQAFLDVPVVESGRTVAELFVHSERPRAWTDDEVAFVRDFAERAHTAIARREAEDRLRGSEARLANALASASLGTFEWDTVTGRVVMDADARRIFGFSDSAEIDQDAVFGRMAQDQVEGVQAAAMMAARRGTHPKLDYDIVLPDGRRRFVRSSAVALDGGARMVGVIQDGTALKDTERALVALNETLEARVAARTAELMQTEEVLRQSQKLEAIGQLTGGVAHDFNNLLTVIKSSTDLLKRPDLPEERRIRYVGAISDTVDRAAKLTGQLLAFARRQALQPEVFAACDGVRAITEMVGTLTGARIRLVTDMPEQRCYIDADPSQFDTALVNMAINARDAMTGEGQITIQVAPVEGIPAVRAHAAIYGPYVAVSLSDTGSGIADDKLDQIFEPFFTTKEVGKGTGLGLSQVFGFAKQSGGEVVVSSAVGEGTTFTMYLPRVAAKENEAASVDAPDLPEPGHDTCVLVVEDNADVGSFSVQALIELGYLPILAASADEALTELGKDNDRFDVVFSDVVMPGMNGIDLAKKIRRLYPGLPVVLTSGYSHVLAQEGTHGFELLHKPYSIEQLSRLLRIVANRQRRVAQ